MQDKTLTYIHILILHIIVYTWILFKHKYEFEIVDWKIFFLVIGDEWYPYMNCTVLQEDDDLIARLAAQLENTHLSTSQPRSVPQQQPTQQVSADQLLGGRAVPVQPVAPVPVRAAHPAAGMRLPLGMVGQYTQYMPPVQPVMPQNERIVRQWAMANRLPPPNYMTQTVINQLVCITVV